MDECTFGPPALLLWLIHADRVQAVSRHPARHTVHPLCGRFAGRVRAILAAHEVHAVAKEESAFGSFGRNEIVDTRVGLPVGRPYPYEGNCVDIGKDMTHISPAFFRDIRHKQFVGPQTYEYVVRSECVNIMTEFAGTAPDLGGRAVPDDTIECMAVFFGIGGKAPLIKRYM